MKRFHLLIRTTIPLFSFLLCATVVACQENDDSNDDIKPVDIEEPVPDPNRSIRFIPISSVEESVLPPPPSPFKGDNTSVTEVFEDNGLYYMLVNDIIGGWPATRINVALLKSTDLVNWEWLPQPIFTSANMPYNFAQPHGFATSVLKTSEGKYLIYFDAFDRDQNKGIGIAHSESLTGPYTIENDLVLRESNERYDAAAVAGADVLQVADMFHMYYMGVPEDINSGETGMCLATSDDGFNWNALPAPVLTKSEGNEFDNHKVGVPKVIQDGDVYIVVYRSENGDGTWGGNSSYGIAKSQDGITWERIQAGPVLSENDVSNWRTVWSCGLIKNTGSLHLFLEYDGPPVFKTRVNHAVYDPQ